MTNVEGRFAGQSGNTGCRHTTLQQADEIRSAARLATAADPAANGQASDYRVAESLRQYSDEELRALRTAGMVDPKEPGRGGAYYATGNYWPDELERQAGALERKIPKLRLAAAAMRREMLRWPATNDGEVSA